MTAEPFHTPPVAPGTTSPPPPSHVTTEPFPTLSALQAAHADLVRDLTGDLLGGDRPDRVVSFVRRAVVTGGVLSPAEDRAAAQDLIGFWTARMTTAVREKARAARKEARRDGLHEPVHPPDFGDTLLAPFDTAPDRVAAAAAEEWVNRLLDADREVARKVVLRLVRLNSADVAEPVTVHSDELADIMPQERVRPVLDRLIALGVVRTGTENGRPSIAFQSQQVLAHWPWLNGLIERRVQFRKKAKRWAPPAAAAVPPAGWFGKVWVGVLGGLNAIGARVRKVLFKLIRQSRDSGMGVFTEEELRAADDYRDRSDPELRVVYFWRKFEEEQTRRDRFWIGGLAILAALLGMVSSIAVVVAVLALSADQAKTKAELDRTKAELEKTKAEGEKAEEERQRIEAERKESELRTWTLKVDDFDKLLWADATKLFKDDEVRSEVLKKGLDLNALKSDQVREDPQLMDLFERKGYQFPTTVTVAVTDSLRDGYDPDFLGGLPLPSLSRELKAKAYKPDAPLKYYHYSLVLHDTRRVAIFAAAAHDRQRRLSIPRGLGNFTLDARVPPGKQTDAKVYTNNAFDRGHLVARQDIAWGEPPTVDGKPATTVFEADVNVYSNITPQYGPFNQGIWNDLEEWVRAKHNEKAGRVIIFTGPVLQEDDVNRFGIQIPRSFWKVAVSRNPNQPEKLVVDAFVIDQYDKATTEKVLHADYRRGSFKPDQHRVAVAELEKLTGLDFGPAVREGRLPLPQAKK